MAPPLWLNCERNNLLSVTYTTLRRTLFDKPVVVAEAECV